MAGKVRVTIPRRRVLEFVAEFGGGLTFGGRDAQSNMRNAARDLLKEGHLTGSSYQHITGMTDSGRKLLAVARRRDAAKKRLAFKKDREQFEACEGCAGDRRDD